MSCEHLVCAQCAGPVVEGRCPSCRAGKAKLHHQGPGGLSPAVVVVILLALFFFSLALQHLVGG
ncbi:hypothetical protein Misp01_04280 [Microtetraspora sp. NBRC 13810]|uniref:hypothetical protein n=1 Tax=Microtetraspora sp. NBRC 13810 TaxID=3030990 RepID=UPI0024A10D31|nr:hypothetical protein [Microtetraspora sp. NBRC 13810]GLW05298.1 hypothetical protein Misp01_04280 [Microtetraspora sp. NBRC 13810]